MKPLHCTLLTPPGTGAIAVIRLTGQGAWSELRRRIRTRTGELPSKPVSGRLYYGDYLEDNQVVDDVLLTWRQGDRDTPDTVEASCHGGIRVVERILISMTALGAVPVSAEQTSGLIPNPTDLIQSEGMKHLERTTTRRGARFLMRQMILLRQELQRIVVIAGAEGVRAARRGLTALLERSQPAAYFYDGANIALVGPANAGKSFLANRLAARQGAVVADRPGTTFDWVTHHCAFDGIPMTLIDTAGLRPTTDDLERLAIKRGARKAAAADLHLLVVDSASDHPPRIDTWLEAVSPGRMIILANKADLVTVESFPTDGPGNSPRVIRVSALTGQGLEDVRRAVVERLGITPQSENTAMVFGARLTKELTELVAESGASENDWVDQLRALIVSR